MRTQGTAGTASGRTAGLAFACLLATAAQAQPQPNTEASIARGATLFALHCTGCHGVDGRARVDVIANATDLTEPALYLNGSTPDDVLRSIREGAGVAMPAFGPQLNDPADIGHLANFVRSLWPAAQRPPIDGAPASAPAAEQSP